MSGGPGHWGATLGRSVGPCGVTWMVFFFATFQKKNGFAWWFLLLTWFLLKPQVTFRFFCFFLVLFLFIFRFVFVTELRPNTAAGLAAPIGFPSLFFTATSGGSYAPAPVQVGALQKKKDGFEQTEILKVWKKHSIVSNIVDLILRGCEIDGIVSRTWQVILWKIATLCNTGTLNWRPMFPGHIMVFKLSKNQQSGRA